MATERDDTGWEVISGRLTDVWERAAPVRDRVRARVTVDTRALAVMRMALATILLGDLAYRSLYLREFYTDAGMYPLAAYEATYTQYNGLSVHALSGDLWFQQLVFVIAGLFALALLLGYRTRLVGFVSFALLISLHARNPALLNGGDRLLGVVLFVSLAAPLGERWSIDALRRGEAREQRGASDASASNIANGDDRSREQVASFGTAAVLCQPIVVFTANAMLKHRGENWYSGDALEVALANDTMTIFLGNSLTEYPTLLTLLNYGWILLLAGSVPFLLLTVGRLRALAVFAYLSAFTGMALAMTVGVFPFTLAASVLPFLTTPFWAAVGRRVPESVRARKPTVEMLGPLGNPPLERRLLDRLRDRGYEDGADFAVAYAQSFMTMAGLLVLTWMLLFAADDVSGFEVPEQIDSTHLDRQSWGLYAPDPSESYSWFVPEAELENGTRVHAFEGGPPDFDRPPDAAATYDSFRHRKFHQAVRDAGSGDTNGIIARSYADWVCRQANDRHDGAVKQVNIYRMFQLSPVGGEYPEPPTKLVVIRWECGQDPANPPEGRLAPAGS